MNLHFNFFFVQLGEEKLSGCEQDQYLVLLMNSVFK